MTTSKKKEPLGSAWERDKKYGSRITDAFALGEPFYLLAGIVNEDVVETTFGEAKTCSLLVQRLGEGNRPVGSPFKAGSIASAIVEKIEAAVPDDFPAVVTLLEVPSKQAKKGKALVLQYVGNGDTAELLAEFGLDASDAGRMVDTLRPASERLGL